MPKIIPLRELKNASKISELVHSNEEPIFVTKNGVSDLVIMSSDKYDSLNKTVYDFKANDYQVSESSLLKDIYKRDNKPLYSIFELKNTLEPIFKKHKVKKAILFGSYVKGTADTRSDIDIVVETNLTGLDFYGLLGDVTDSLRFPVDLINKKSIKKNSEFEKEISKTGVVIYE